MDPLCVTKNGVGVDTIKSHVDDSILLKPRKIIIFDYLKIIEFKRKWLGLTPTFGRKSKPLPNQFNDSVLSRKNANLIFLFIVVI
jgi:hypothetical protein